MSDSSSGLNFHATDITTEINDQSFIEERPILHACSVLYIYAPFADEVLIRSVMNKAGITYRLNDYRVGRWSEQHTLCFFKFNQLNSFQQLLLQDATQQKAQIMPLNDYFELHFGYIEVDLLRPEQLLPMDRNALSAASGYKQYARGLTDKLIALVALAVIFPFAVLAAVAIKLDSRGPVFFCQQRTGLYNRQFNIIKFRSMTHDAEREGAQWAAVDDKRITAVGQFLRKTRFDELPQLINVLKGDMALIGPRPEREVFMHELENKVPFYRFRHLVKPGITGLAQVSAGYGASVEDAREKHRHDLYYIKYRSLWLDLKIIWKTLRIVLLGKGV